MCFSGGAANDDILTLIIRGRGRTLDYKSLEEIKTMFSIEESEPTEIRKKLILLMKIDHPDINHPDEKPGEYHSEAHKKKCEQLQAAISFIDDYNKTTIPMKVNDITELVKVIRDVIVPQQPLESEVEKAEKKLTETTDKFLEVFQNKYRFPKITFSTLSVGISLLWVFPQTISEHKVLNQYIDVNSPEFVAIWITSLFFCIAVWGLSYIAIDQEKALIEQLSIESYQNLLFNAFTREIDSPIDATGESTERFVKTDFVQFIEYHKYENIMYRHDMSYSRERRYIRCERAMNLDCFYIVKKLFYKIYMLFGSKKVELAVAQNVATVILSRAEEKGIINKLQTTMMDDMYSFQIE